MTLRAVLFDLWETLIQDRPDRNHPRRAWRAGAVSAVLAKYDCDASIDAVSQALDATSLALTAMHDQGCDIDWDARAEMFLTHLDAAAGCTTPRAAAEALHDVIASMPVEMAPHLAPHAAETLAELRESGIGLGLISNVGLTTAPNLRRLLEHYGILDHFDVMAFSDELLVAKPDERIFTAALTGLGFVAAECAFVGDNPLCDVYGASQAGLFAVQIGSKARDGCTPSLRINSLNELVPALGTAFDLD
jgi:putative hydrolase of the HAD superfamily